MSFAGIRIRGRVCGLGGNQGNSYNLFLDKFGELTSNSQTKSVQLAAEFGYVVVDNLGSGMDMYNLVIQNLEIW